MRSLAIVPRCARNDSSFSTLSVKGGQETVIPSEARNAFILVFFLFAISPFSLFSQASLMRSDGMIYNTGTIRVRGDAVIAQDTMGGTFRYERNNADSQLVAHLTYTNLHFEGVSVKKMLDASEPVIADSLFWSVDTNVVIDLIPASYIRANRTVRHEGFVNPGQRQGRFVLMGTENQDVSGKGMVPILELNNIAGASMTRNAAFRIYERLDLQVGQLTNSAADNIDMQRSAWIWRDDSGSIVNEPRWDTRVNLRYYGDSLMLGGGEMVRNQTAIGHLVQDDIAGVMLPWDIYVNDSLILRGHIFTEESPTAQHELLYTNTIDPWYDGLWPEIIGTMVRTNIPSDRSLLMNNAHTTVYFAAADRGAVQHWALRSMPQTTPLPLTDITFKVNRYLQMEARLADGSIVPDSTFSLTFGYAWRNRELGPNETPASAIETISQLRGQEQDLVLMRYDGTSYEEYGLSRMPTQTAVALPEVWRYSTTQFVRANGDYAIGLATGPVWVLNTKVFLEGPLRTYGENFTPVMATDLALRGLIPNTAPNIYPYSLDPDRLLDTATVIGDSIVDWVTVEFRTSPSASEPPKLIETLLLTKDGQMLDPQTLRPRIIAGIPAGLYNIAVRHRNHLAAITEDKILVNRGNIGYVVDFTTGVGIFGGAPSQKLIGTDATGRRWFGLIAGEANFGSEIDRTDYNLVWDNRNLETYTVFDTDLNGIVTTRDINVTWNNRGRLTLVP